MTTGVEQIKRDLKRWSNWWITMWLLIVVVLLGSIPFVSFGHWVTLALLLFGPPETFGALKTGDAYPPLTNVIVKYLHREIAYPLFFFFAGSTAAYWFAFPKKAWALGLFAGLLGWLVAHFEVRYERR